MHHRLEGTMNYKVGCYGTTQLYLHFPHMWTCVTMQAGYFACKLSKFAMEMKISIRQAMEFLLDEMCNFHGIWYFHKM